MYNCHGMIFAARRTQIWDPAQVEKILAEDGYTRVSKDDLEVGDIVMYKNRENGDWEHSCIVVEKLNLAGLPWIKVLGKWGRAHEVVHFLGDSPYAQHEPLYYRLEQ